MIMFKLALASLAAIAVTEAVQYGAPIDPGYGQAMAPRDDCAQLPALCTGPVMMQGMATTLTYLCPKTSEAPTTVHVTVTKTTTVTAEPGQSSGAAVPPKDVPASAEPTTTTTVLSTQTQYKTITVSRKKDSSSSAPGPGPTDFIPSVTSDWLRPPVETSPLPIPESSIVPNVTSDWLHPITTTEVGKNSTGTAWSSKPTIGSNISGKPTMHINSTGYFFPTPHQMREGDPSASAKPATGFASRTGSSVEMVLLGLVTAVLVHEAIFGWSF